MNKKILVWIIAIIICSNLAFALGVRSAKTEINFQPVYHGTFKVVNNEHKDLKVKLHPAGELKDYIKLEYNEVSLAPDENFKPVPFTLELPSELTPGIRKGKITIEEELAKINTDNGQITANIKLAHKIYVNVPAIDKYVEAKIDINPKEDGSEVVTTIRNIGTTDLSQVKSKVEVYSGEEKVAVYDNPPEPLEVASSRSFKNFIEDNQIGEGSYRVISTINYDENVLEIVKTFTKGSPSIEILNYEKYFMQNKINEFGVEIASRWNTLIEGVYITISVLKDGKEMFSTKTLSFNLEPFENKKINTFLDARNLNLGTYDINLSVHYAGKVTSKMFKANVLTKKEYESKKEKSTLLYVMAGFMIVIFIAIIVLFYFMLCIKKEKFK